MRSIPSAAFAAGLLFLVGCAGGAGPDLSGPQGPSLMAAYSGDWTLLRLESDNLAENLRGAMGASGGAAGGRSGGGMTGGRGGRGGGRGGTMPAQMDPEEMRAAMETVRTLSETPDEMTITLRPDRVTLTPRDQAVLSLVLGGEEERFYQGNLEFSARAKWTSKGLEVEREAASGFAVADEISVDEQGRLVVKRKIHLMGRSVDGTLIYSRGGN